MVDGWLAGASLGSASALIGSTGGCARVLIGLAGRLAACVSAWKSPSCLRLGGKPNSQTPWQGTASTVAPLRQGPDPGQAASPIVLFSLINTKKAVQVARGADDTGIF